MKRNSIYKLCSGKTSDRFCFIEQSFCILSLNYLTVIFIKVLTYSLYSGKQSELHVMLADLIAENKRLNLDGARQLESLMNGVHDAILQLQADTKRRNDLLQEKPKTIAELSTDDSTGVVPSWEGMKDLSTNVSRLAKEVRSSASDQMLLNSLWADHINRRRATVESAHQETFKWVLDPSSPSKFDNWLRYHNGIYWIMGKAGSGKSTLMKFLLDHTRTADSLTMWAGTKELVIASYFFWNSGHSIQRSQEGLFRSLLHEILSQCPDLVRTVCASKAATIRPFVKEVEPWTRQELWHAIEQLKDQSWVRARFCFFIDGLDEYDGDPNDIVTVLESLRSWPDIKLCISSRPWNEFKDAFGRYSDLQLALEDLTREDIKIYVRDTLEENSRFRALKFKDDRSQDLVLEIVTKARGVFLWVVLVIKSLLTGLSNADSICDLQRRLRGFPETLEKYFGHMIASVEPMYREQTAQAFKFALEAASPLTLTMYSFLDDEDLDSVIAAPLNPLTPEDILSRHDDMERRLSARCKGLLEVDSRPKKKHGQYSYRDLFSERKVQFHHRTVRDFLHTKDMQIMLSKYLKADFQPKVQFCKALLAQLKVLDYGLLGIGSLKSTKLLSRLLLLNLTFYARQIEDETKVPQVSLLDEVGRLPKEAPILGSVSDELDFLRFLVRRKFHLYITEVLIARKSLTQADKTILLGSTLDPFESHGKASIVNIANHLNSDENVKMVDILLHHGAQPNGKYNDSTAWGQFLQRLNRTRFDDGLEYERKKASLMIVRSLLFYGANPQERIVTAENTLATKETGRASVPHTIIAQEILVKAFGEEKITELLKEAPESSESLQKEQKDQKSVPSSSKRWSRRSLLASLKFPRRRK